MIKSDLTHILWEKLNITQKDADKLLTTFMEVVGETLEKGEKVQLAGFGVFDLRYLPEHQGRNPKTGEVLTVPACHYPIFRAGKGLKDRVAKCKQTFASEIVDTNSKKVQAGTIAPSPKPARKKKNSPLLEKTK